MIRALIFDLEGVVIDSEILWDKAAEIFLSKRGIAYDRELIKPLLMGGTLEEGAKIWKDLYKLDGSANAIADERREIISDLFKNEVSYIHGFLDFYKKIKGKYLLAIATSSERKFIAMHDSKTGYSKLFDEHVYSIEDIGFIAKPAPDIYLYAAKKLGVKPGKCVGFEDSPRGVASVKSAGMKCVAITTTTKAEKLKDADLIVDSYEKIDLESELFQ